MSAGVQQVVLFGECMIELRRSERGFDEGFGGQVDQSV